MAKIVSGLFGLSPEQVQQQQDQQSLINAQNTGLLVERGSPGWGATAMGVSKIGSGLMKGLDSLLGIEDPQLMKAKDIEQIMKETQDTLGPGATPDEVYEGLYTRLSDKGYAQEALFALDARQKYKDNAKTMELKEKELDAALGNAQVRANEKAATYQQKLASNAMKINEKRFKITSDQYDDPESSLYQAADTFANSMNVDDPEILRTGFQELHKELLSMTITDDYGNLMPLLKPGEAFKWTKKVLSARDEKGNLKYVEHGNWNPTKGTKINLPNDVAAEIRQQIVNEMGIEDNSIDTVPKNLTGDKKEAYKKAIETLKINPSDPIAISALELLGVEPPNTYKATGVNEDQYKQLENLAGF